MKTCLLLSQCWILMQLCTVLYSYTTLCTFEVLMEDNDFNKSSIPLSMQVVAEIKNTQECWLNTTVMLSQINLMDNHTDSQINSTEKEAHLDTDEANEKLILIIRITCITPIPVHLMDFSTQTVNLQLDLYLSISDCSIAMKEISVFQMIGKIIMLRNRVNPQVFEPEYNCSYAGDLVTMRLHTGLTNCSGIIMNSPKIFFWETCVQIFSKLVLLSIDGCVEINTTSIREKFPNIHTLLLENRVIIEGQLQFPWKTEQIMTDISIKNFFKVFYTLNAVHYGLFSVNCLGLRGMFMNIDLVHLDGVINELSLVAMHLYYLKPSFLENVTITDSLDLSNNHLETIDPKLFKNQHQLEHLYLQRNNLRAIQQDMFRSLKRLQYIDLTHNRIETIHIDPFTSLHNLKAILLGHNNIMHIPPDMFKDQTDSLKYLYMSSNPLTDIPVWPLYATNLIEVRLDFTEINGSSIVRVLEQLSMLDQAESNTETALSSCGPYCRQRVINLQNNNITTIPHNKMSFLLAKKLDFLMSTFVMDFSGNPITCNCDTFILQSLALGVSNDYSASNNRLQNCLKTWICVNPPEFQGQMMYNIIDSEKYCPANIDCPHGCNCFKRQTVDTIIVDCTNVPLMNMPTILSSSKLELWFENSSISEISPVPYLENVTYLILSKNKLKQINVSVINKMESIEVIFLHSNHLTSIPIQIRSLHLSTLTLSDNRFVCDCTLRWLKTWLLDSEDLIRDWTKVQCLTNSNKIKQLIALPDSSYVCKKADSFSVAEHVFLPSVIIGCLLFVLITMSLITYFYRFNVKVFLYIHFNIHPFDKETNKEENNTYDSVVIYSPEDVDFRDRIVPYLIQKDYVTADINHDSFIGYTLLRNTERLIHCSTRVIICFSEYSKNNKIAEFAWNIAYEKATTLSMKSIILVTEKQIAQEQNLDDNLRQFIKGNQFINRKAKCLEGKVAYLMPELNRKKQNDIELERQGEQDVAAETRILLFYPDDLHLYVRNELKPFLSANNLDVKYLEMEFMPGCDIQDELPGILDASHHFLFILSQQMVEDEVKMYILTQALTKTQLENHNYLLLATSGHIGLENMTNDLQKYVENYVTISINNAEFKERIFQSIVQDTHSGRENVNNLENDPLLLEGI